MSDVNKNHTMQINKTNAKNDELLRSGRFRKEREHRWVYLEELVSKIEKQKKSSLSPAELLELPRLYRNVLAALAIARAYVLDAHLIRYLDSLALRTHLVVFSPRETFFSITVRLIGRDIPQAVRSLILPIFISAVTLFLGILIGRFLIMERPDLFESLVSSKMAQGRTPFAPIADLKQSIAGGTFTLEQLQAMALRLIQNNILVSLATIGFGLALGIPTAILLLYNGALIGALIGVFALRGMELDFIAWLSIHGTTELGAIIIAGGGGFAIAGSILFPAPKQSRLASAAMVGGKVACLTMAVIIMLLTAGFIEAFARQLIADTPGRFLVGGAFGALWIMYFNSFGRETNIAGNIGKRS